MTHDVATIVAMSLVSLAWCEQWTRPMAKVKRHDLSKHAAVHTPINGSQSNHKRRLDGSKHLNQRCQIFFNGGPLAIFSRK